MFTVAIHHDGECVQFHECAIVHTRPADTSDSSPVITTFDEDGNEACFSNFNVAYIMNRFGVTVQAVRAPSKSIR